MAAENIYQALNVVMGQVGYVQKEGSRNLNYTFAGEAALIAAIRPHFVKEGIVVMPIDVEATDVTYTTKGGVTMNLTSANVAYRFMHAPSGTYQDVVVRGAGADVGDKATAKAMTIAFKYALRQALMIETGDDPDEHSSDPQERQAPAQKSAAAKNGSVDADKLQRALSYAVPDSLPLEKKTFAEIQGDPELGTLMILWLAKEIKNHEGEEFSGEGSVTSAAKFVVSNSPEFQKSLETFKANNADLF